MTTFQPSTPDGLVDACLTRIRAIAGVGVVIVDGPSPTRPGEFADAIARRLRAEGRAAGVVHADDYLRPASLRFEYGRTDPLTFRDGFVDHAGIDREVIDAPRRHGRWLPRLWDAQRDRSFRDSPQTATADQIVLVGGPMLLGRGHDAEVTIALRMSAAALRRRLPDDEHWTIDPLLDHAAAAGPADIEVRYDHPARPAIAVR
ncbi:hypothetical protein GYA93_21005 [Gordonia desulfuricans]|uniref:Uridine kinase n=1 Tax=Gordonia desulfuricans TaxID=89051 RepID=A0A7K3LUZ8_9ACTN|nr:hypothetical protein [Gordonia desulfuricans]NDK92029.1 hypothetical protein [Gordonia desulfuricans]